MTANGIRAVFREPSDGYAAVDRLRATGFRIDLSGSIDGDLVVIIHDGRTRIDEIAALVVAHEGRIDREPATSAALSRQLTRTA